MSQQDDVSAMTDAEVLRFLEDAIPRIRQSAQRVGLMHSGWELIYDIDWLLKGKPPLKNRGPRDLAAQVVKYYPTAPEKP